MRFTFSATVLVAAGRNILPWSVDLPRISDLSLSYTCRQLKCDSSSIPSSLSWTESKVTVPAVMSDWKWVFSANSFWLSHMNQSAEGYTVCDSLTDVDRTSAASTEFSVHWTMLMPLLLLVNQCHHRWLFSLRNAVAFLCSCQTVTHKICELWAYFRSFFDAHLMHQTFSLCLCWFHRRVLLSSKLTVVYTFCYLPTAHRFPPFQVTNTSPFCELIDNSRIHKQKQSAVEGWTGPYIAEVLWSTTNTTNWSSSFRPALNCLVSYLIIRLSDVRIRQSNVC